MKIFTGNANPALAKEICEHLGVPLGTATVNRFPDGETFVQINENIRGCDVYVIQPTCAPANDRIMELLIMIDALRRASAARITAVIPFFGYARQDRKDKPRVPITAKLVANLLTAAGANPSFSERALHHLTTSYQLTPMTGWLAAVLTPGLSKV